MGKRIIQQARGKGSHTYKVRRKAFSVKPKYPTDLQGEYKIISLFSSAGHTVPIIKLKNKKGEVFENLAANLIYEGQKINFGGKKVGDIAMMKDIANGTEIFNLENNPNDGGKLVRTGGNSATLLRKQGKKIVVLMPSKKEKLFSPECRATIGVAAGQGRLDKPVLKAGKKFYIKKAKSKLWPRTSAVKMNAIDHPFGSGRGKRPKSKIIPRNASPGQKVGLLRPRRTGRKKR
jgi:large subunit ribosomal protein L2